LLIGLLAVAIALAVAVPLTASIVMNGIRDIKTKRDTIVATGFAEERASTIAQELGGHLGAVRNVNLGVYQITPRNSTDLSNEGISDTSSREKDVTAVVSVTFAVNR
jgi:hypothetical protein